MCQNCQNNQVGNAPYRVDHVGSFLRPKELVEAREKFAKGELSKEELTKVELCWCRNSLFNFRSISY